MDKILVTGGAGYIGSVLVPIFDEIAIIIYLELDSELNARSLKRNSQESYDPECGVHLFRHTELMMIVPTATSERPSEVGGRGDDLFL